MARLRDIVVDVTPLRRSRQFRLLYVAVSLSAVGSRVTDVAIPVQVWRLTHSTFAVGGVAAVTMIPRLVFSVMGGALADAKERRRLIIGAEAVGLLASFALAINATTSHPRLWLVYVLAAMSASGYSLGSAPSRSTVPLVIEPDLLTPALALQSITWSISWLIGPAIGGVLIASFGLAAPYFVDVGSFALALACLWAMAAIPPVTDTNRVSWRSVTEGVRAMWQRPPVAGCFLVDLNAMVFGFPSALFPAVAALRFPNHQGFIGLLYSAPFAGSLIASATSGWSKRVKRQGRAVIVAAGAWGAAIVGFGLVSSLWASLVFLAAAGGCDMVSGVFRQSILNTATPPEMLGRMEGVGMAVWTTGPALGDLEAGGVASLTSVTTSIVSGGAICVAGTLALAVALPAFARYERPVTVKAS